MKPLTNAQHHLHTALLPYVRLLAVFNSHATLPVRVFKQAWQDLDSASFAASGQQQHQRLECHTAAGTQPLTHPLQLRSELLLLQLPVLVR